MTPERWQQINELYHDALELDANRQATFLNQACAGDAELRDEVVSLICSHDQSGSFIAEPAMKVAARVLAEDQATSLVGRRFSHYQIESLLGVGGMAEVYLAEDTSLGRKVALKLLPAYFTRDGERLRRFEQEAHAASALNHPNILTIYEMGQVDGHHYTATEFIDGETLREHMAGTRMRLDESLDIAAQVASALAAAHAAGIVHRDIKPENVMLRSDGFVKVLDFGLAKLAPRHASMSEPDAPAKSMVKTNPGMVMGTVQYMSPEQARGQDVDARTDIWSLGVVLYEMVTGSAPFAGETPSHVVVSILEKQPSAFVAELDVPPALEGIISKALRKSVAKRYQTAADLALDLKSLKQDLEVEARLNRSRRSDGSGGQAAPKSEELARPVSRTKVDLEASISGKADAVTPPQPEQQGDLEPEPASKSSWLRSQKRWLFAVATVFLGGLLSLAVLLTIKARAPRQELQPQPPATSTAGPERTLTYWLLVRRPHEQQPFESIGNGVFDGGSKFWFNVQTPQTGALYLISYGRNDHSVYEWNTMFPTPINNNGDAWLPANHANPLRTKTAYLLQGRSGIIEMWIIWADERIPLLDDITRQSYNTQGTVSEPAHQTALHTFLEQHKASPPEIIVDKENARVTLKGRSAVLVDRRELEYRTAGGG